MTQTEFERMRMEFPNPVRCHGAGKSQREYCVMGALNKFRNGQLASGFPGSVDLLARENPALPHDEAARLSRLIVHANDEGNFERAWTLLHRAVVEKDELAAPEKRPEREATGLVATPGFACW